MKVTPEKAKGSVSVGTRELDASLPKKDYVLDGRRGIYWRTIFL